MKLTRKHLFRKGLPLLICACISTAFPIIQPYASQKGDTASDEPASTEAFMLTSANNESYSSLQDLTLHIISPEEKDVTVKDLAKNVRIFVFGDISNCTNTKGVIQQMEKLIQGVDLDIYYMDIKNNTADTILRFGMALAADNLSLCVDTDKAYLGATRSLGYMSFTMPVVVVLGTDDSTIFNSSFSGDTAAFTSSIKESIFNAYPDLDPGITPYCDEIYMVPNTQRPFPVLHKENYSYSSDSSRIAIMDTTSGTIFSRSAGDTILKVTDGSSTKEVTLHVLTSKESYQAEWDTLKGLNQERLSAGKEPLSSTDKLQQLADIRAYEILNSQEHMRTDGSSIGTLLSEVGIINYTNYAENIAWGQATPKEVIASWMNSDGHRENMLRETHTHVGTGFQNDK